MNKEISPYQIVIIVAVVISLIAFFSLGNILYRSRQIEGYQETLIQDIEELKEEGDKLRALLDYSQSERFYIREAKEDLDKREDGEEVYFISESSQSSVPTYAYDKTPFQKWLKYFFRF